MTTFDPGPNRFGADFGGREVVASCAICGTPLANLSRHPEWVDRANNKAADSPHFHEHTP